MIPQSDELLWSKFKAGDREALDRIFHLNINFLLDYSIRLTSDHALAEDCIQDLFVRLWSQRTTLGSTDNIRFYLMRSLRRMISRNISNSAKRLARERISEDYDFEVEFSHEIHLINDQITSQRKAQLGAALELLSRRQKEVIYHKFYNGLSSPEIAELMEISIGSVYNLTSKALEMLCDRIKHWGHKKASK